MKCTGFVNLNWDCQRKEVPLERSRRREMTLISEITRDVRYRDGGRVVLAGEGTRRREQESCDWALICHRIWQYSRELFTCRRVLRNPTYLVGPTCSL